MSETIHVFPNGDSRPHYLEGGDCACKPRVETSDPKTGKPYPDGGKLVIHRAFDGREIIEEAEAIKEATERLLE